MFGEHGDLCRAIYVQILNSDCQHGLKEAFITRRKVKLSEVGVLSVYFGAVIKGSLNGLSGWLGPWQQAEDRQCPGHLLP